MFKRKEKKGGLGFEIVTGTIVDEVVVTVLIRASILVVGLATTFVAPGIGLGFGVVDHVEVALDGGDDGGHLVGV